MYEIIKKTIPTTIDNNSDLLTYIFFNCFLAKKIIKKDNKHKPNNA